MFYCDCCRRIGIHGFLFMNAALNLSRVPVCSLFLLVHLQVIFAL